MSVSDEAELDSVSASMLRRARMLRRPPIIPGGICTIWCLLALWLLFGYLELGEQAGIVPSASANTQPDVDADALAQLGTGLKPEALPSQGPAFASPSAAIVTPTVLSSCSALQIDRRMRHCRSSLRPSQRLSIYRI